MRRSNQSGAIISKQFADDHHLAIGSTLRVETQSGTRLDLTVRGIQQLPAVTGLLGPVVIGTTLFDRSFAEPGDIAAVVDTAGGSSPAAQRSLTKLLAGFPNAKIQTIAAFIKSQQAQITSLLNLFYVLLALAIVVSLFGIVNTLVLSIVERTREIGALRAMGMTRRQLKRMIRIESQITALIGAVIGIVVGVALAGLTTAALSTWSLTFTVPWSTLVAHGRDRLLRRQTRQQTPRAPSRPPQPTASTPIRIGPSSRSHASSGGDAHPREHEGMRCRPRPSQATCSSPLASPTASSAWPSA